MYNIGYLKNAFLWLFAIAEKWLNYGLFSAMVNSNTREPSCDHVRKDSRFNKEIVMTTKSALAHKVCLSAEEQGYNPELLNALAEHPSLFREMLEVQQGRANVVPIEVKSEPPLDTLIHVDRSIRPIYPDWVKLVNHPKIGNTGPADYDLATQVKQWLHEQQKNGGSMCGTLLYKDIRGNGILPTCLSLRDLEEIRKKGIVVFRKFFAGVAVFAWKSVVQSRGGGLLVPYLIVRGGRVVVRWGWLEDDWYGRHPALRFVS